MIELKNIQKIFNKKGVKVEALKGVNLQVDKGDIFGVIGFSGAGKSTLIRMVNYLEQPTSGEVIVDNKNLGKLTTKELREVRKQIGMIFQHFNLLESKNVFENIAIPLVLNHRTKDEIESRVNELLEFVGLEDKAKAYPSELSGGQKQRIGIARALATNPLILLCDEATSALDPQTTGSILQLLKKINREYNITILMITHEMAVIREVCNKVAVMENGEIIEQGNLLEVFGNPKEQTTKNFVKTVVHDEVPQVILDEINSEDENSKVLKLKFIGENSKKAILAEACSEFNVQPNILFANVTELQGNILGNLIVELKGEKEDIENAHKYMKDRKVGVEEVLI
ncbi:MULTISPECIES: methionine ABC transporter ATP-binding protein [Clostridium]|jgi:D-methionine transport system ATP-binding protein|uniref:Methionine import ATP-binding protein MetN n=3 Tax=Clostridium TaxID=1485 RepID=A0AAV3VXJ2_9CLOT|nr:MULTISPECIES: ATP-binding cassette domain-containing protein [Clostridium]ALB45812.1 ATP-binding cassette domain-containing protein [Clostridium beijerinckii NRRL B-598]MBC2457364.1 ATP-binding cassette domain-containing protein [Clostridium beijerinckii]MBC2474492.1 ATP-binding cassette domain-containing protein [Clostridium beijerinckii]MCI1580222.1 ATP-binding cassette domain-containing protein [Clostridium beijerinckii]MCI1583222.1 ATP-binding cassette domain-containing protein [Clostri